jgi:hypothetical protein
MTEQNDWLRHAIEENNASRVRELLGHGASPYEKGADGLSAFNLAGSDRLEILKLMTEIAFEDTKKNQGERRWPTYDINTPSGKYNSTLIVYGCKVCDVPTVEDMLKHGAKTDVVNDSGWNLFHVTAVMPGRTGMLKMLKATLGGELLARLSSKPYETAYNGRKVHYASSTPYNLCRQRMQQDSNHPAEMSEYLKILGPDVAVAPPASGAVKGA